MDELDDILNQHAELEARFKELEDRVDLEELKAEVQWSEHELRTGRSEPSAVSPSVPSPAYSRPGASRSEPSKGHSSGGLQYVEIGEPEEFQAPDASRGFKASVQSPGVATAPGPSTHPDESRLAASAATDDPTAALKARLDGREDVLFLVVLCPKCDGKNRTRLDRLRTAVPRCGRCGGDLTRLR